MRLGVSKFGIMGAVLGAFAACSAKEPRYDQIPVVKVVEEYKPAFRQSPPEPVYSRFMWAHAPEPLPIKGRDNAPLIMPVVDFDLANSNVSESVEALAQTIGYTWDYPPQAASRKVRIKMTAGVDEILQEIARQSRLRGVLDHQSKVLRLIDLAS